MTVIHYAIRFPVMQAIDYVVQTVDLLCKRLRPIQISCILHLGLSPFEMQAVRKIMDASFDNDLPCVYQ